MAIRTYALVVEHEIFDLIEVDDDFPLAQRWRDGFANNPIGVHVDKSVPAGIGSAWNGSTLTSSDNTELFTFSDESEIYVLISNNIVFAAISPTQNTAQLNSYAPAFATGVTGADVTDFPTVQIGWTVNSDGTFSAPGGA